MLFYQIKSTKPHLEFLTIRFQKVNTCIFLGTVLGS